jgi:hypothetical protein
MNYYRFILLICVATFVFACNKEEASWHDTQYVFLEQHKTEYSELLEGECYHLCIDFPSYTFYPETGVLRDQGNGIKMDKKLQMVLGRGVSAGGAASSGAGTSIYPIRDFPNKEHGITLEKLDPDGTAYFTYRDSSMVLTANQEWVSIKYEIDTILNYDSNDTLGIVKYTYTNRITNWGLLHKKDFEESGEW